MTRNKALLLLSTISLLSACSGGVDVSSHPEESSTDSTSQIASSEEKANSSIASSEASSSEISSNEVPISSEESSSSIEESISSSESVSSETASSEPPAVKYRLRCSFQSGITQTGLRSSLSYAEGEEVTFTVIYDGSVYLAPTVKLNGEVIDPVEEGGKDYRFLMPAQESSLTIEAEEVVKKYAILTNEIDDSIVRLDYLSEGFDGSSVLPDTEVKFALTLLNSDYEIVSVSATYVDEDSVTQELDLSLENGIYSFTMPASAVSIHVSTGQLHSIVYHGSSSGYAISYLEGSSAKVAVGKTVRFKLTNRDPSYSLNFVSVYSGATVENGAWVGSGNTCKIESDDNDTYHFVMPDNDVHIIVNVTKSYSISTSLDSGVEAISFENKQSYYKYNAEVAFSLTFKEGFKAKKVEIVYGSDDDEITTAIAPDSTGKYTFLIKADTTIKVASQSEEVSSFWTERTMYYYKDQSGTNKDWTAEEIIINPDTATVDYAVYKQEIEYWGGDWYSYRPVRRVAYGSGTTPDWHDESNYWSIMDSYHGTNIPYEFDKSTMKLTFSINSRAYTLSFDSTASTFTIDANIYSDFYTTGKTFQKWVG